LKPVARQHQSLPLLKLSASRPRPTMVHSSLSLLLVFVTAGASPTYECVLTSSDVVTDAFNSALDIWAATKRCDHKFNSPALCEQDIASSISDLTALASGIAGIVGSCADVTMNKCGLAANDLVSVSAGLAAAGGAIAESCTSIEEKDVLELQTDLGKCTGDATDGLNSMLHATTSLGEMQSSCSGNAGDCTVPTLEVVSVLASIGSYISAAFSDCSAFAKSPVNTDAADCASAVLDGVAQLSAAAEAGLQLKDACSASASRLYLDTKGQATSSSPGLTALAALLPLAAVLGFVAGSRFAKNRGHAQQTGLLTTGDGIEHEPLTACDSQAVESVRDLEHI